MANHTAGRVPFSWPFKKWRRFPSSVKPAEKTDPRLTPPLRRSTRHVRPPPKKANPFSKLSRPRALTWQRVEGRIRPFVCRETKLFVAIAIIINQLLIWQSQQNLAASACGANQWPTLCHAISETLETLSLTRKQMWFNAVRERYWLERRLAVGPNLFKLDSFLKGR